MAQQKTRESEITDRLVAIAENGASEFERHAVKRDIESLLKINPYLHFMLMGMFYSAIGKYNESKLNHEESLRYNKSSFSYLNYGISMKTLGKMSEALELCLSAFEIEPVLGIFAEAIDTMLCSGNFDKLNYAVSRFSKANPEIDLNSIKILDKAKKIIEYLDRVGIPKHELNIATLSVENILISSGASTRGREILIDRSFDGVPHIYIEIYALINKADELDAINEKIIDAIISNNELSCWDRIIIKVLHFSR